MQDFEKLYTKVLKFISFRPRSEKEIRDYLLHKKTDEKMIEIIVKLLNDQAFLNDKEFARMWLESRSRSKPRSTRVIKMELKQKGISQEIIEQTIADANDDIVSDEALAYKIVDQKIAKYKNLSKEQLYEKLAGQLGRRGFNWDIIKKVLAEYL